ncbi:MAG: mechanosensitive ion channel [Oscillospiraceae bacterium]|jgi:small conductance mechanosensitive channel|nr:mechanosensitive ion channel [Oscillospiraceae bacterium]
MNFETIFLFLEKANNQFLNFFLKEDFWWQVVNFFKALVVFFSGLPASKIVGKITKKAMLRTGAAKSAVNFFSSGSKLTLKILFLFLALSCYISLNTMLATVGGALVALGFILKDSISNMLSGIIIVTNKLFSLEDTIKIESNEGRVLKIETFFTTLVNNDGKKIIVPNSLLTSKMLIKQDTKKQENI